MNLRSGFLGDIVRAFAALAPGDERTLEAITAALSFVESTTPKIRKVAGAQARPPDMHSGSVGQPALSPSRSVSPSPPGPRMARERLQPVTFEPPSLDSPWRAVMPLPAVRPDHLAPSLAYQPLLVQRWSRAIITATLATDGEYGPVDVLRLVESVARGRPVRQIPRHPWRSLCLGVQVLADLGEGMEPFARDQDQIIEEIRRTVGRGAVWLLQFRRCPTRGAGAGPIWTWKGYVPPRPGTPVLLLSDLGMGGPHFDPSRPRVKEWRDFTRRVHRCGCPLLAFVPWPEERWPAGLSRSITLLRWDRGTTVRSVDRAVRRRRRGRR